MLLEACIKARLNVVISGGTGCGKTTLLNTLSSFIPHDERIVTIEDAAELQLQQDHVVRLETRPPNIEGKGAISDARPGAERPADAARADHHRRMPGRRDARHAPGHEHRPRRLDDDAATRTRRATRLSRLETMIMMGGFELPIKAMRQQIATAVDLIIQANRLQGGPRKITSITEVMNMEQDMIIMQEIFRFRQLGIDQNGRAFGQFEATGVRPSFVPRLEQKGIKLPVEHVHRADPVTGLSGNGTGRSRIRGRRDAGRGPNDRQEGARTRPTRGRRGRP